MHLERWEHLSRILEADAEDADVRAYMERYWHGDTPPRYSPEALMPALDELGEQGWELVSLQPVLLDRNHDIDWNHAGCLFSHTYMTAFKRRKG